MKPHGGDGWIIILGIILVFLACGSSQNCLPERDSVSRRYFYQGDSILGLSIEVSRRLSHQLVSNILKIILHDSLGYDDVKLVQKDEAVSSSSTLQRITGCRSEPERCKTPEDFIPDVMINLEVWIGPDFDLHQWTKSTEIEDCGPLGPIVKLGWYISQHHVKDLWVKNEIILNHWRTYQNPKIVTTLNYLEEIVLNNWTFDKSNGAYYCSQPMCNLGIFQPSQCRDTNINCATLLTDYPSSSYEVLKNQILRLNLLVSVAWVGRHLEAIIDEFTSAGRPVLIFYWKPSEIISSGNFSYLSFPPCKYDNGTTLFPCEYEISQLQKVSWRTVKTNAPYVHHVIHSMSLNPDQYRTLLNLSSSSGLSMQSVACKWIREYEQVWRTWLPLNFTKKPILYIGGIFPVTSPYKELNGVAPAAELAVEAVNQNTSILKDYHLELLTKDGRCMADVVMKQFIGYVTNSSYNQIIGILGSACSDTVEPIAGVGKHFNAIIISYSAEGALFNNRDKYPFFLRTIPENTQLRFVYLKLLVHLGWEHVAALTEDGQIYPEYLSLLQDLLQSHGMNFIINRKFPRELASPDMSQYLLDLKEKNARIIIGVFYDSAARAIMCDAYKQKMTARYGYQWFLPAWFSANWFDTDYYNSHGESIPCTTEQMVTAIDGHISLAYTFYAETNSIMQEGKTVGRWKEEYKNYALLKNTTFSKYGGYAYDAVWVYALALNALLEENETHVATLHSDITTHKFMSLLSNSNFTGVSGRVHFVGSSRVLEIVIWQWHKNVTHEIGRYYPNIISEEKGILQINESSIVWLTPDGKKPSDRGKDPVLCSIERFRAMLDVSCELALVVMNILGFSVFALVLLIAFMLLKQRYEGEMKQTKARMKELGLVAAHNLLTLDEWEIPRNHIVINRRLGEGAFGTVYGGETFLSSKGWVAVAVKALKSGSSPSEKLDFLSEAEMMKRFDHRNIISLLGVCTKGEPVYLVMEFTLYGNLKTYLLSRRTLVAEDSNNQEVSSSCLTNMALDTARGLSYLAEMKYVHRDLACRNCLVSSNRIVKISDFGMCRPTFDCDCYKFHKKGMMPIRWMAPESLSGGIFTPMTDIWSYGIVLYEIVTFGSFPFQGLSNNQVLEYVSSGHTLSIPKNCKAELQSLMMQCWSQDPTQRPTATKIVEILANNPNLISPSLDVPLASVEVQGSDSTELVFQEHNKVQPSPPAVLKPRESKLINVALSNCNRNNTETETCLDSMPLIKCPASHATVTSNYKWNDDNRTEADACLESPSLMTGPKFQSNEGDYVKLNMKDDQ